jgi:hypothetical protein
VLNSDYLHMFRRPLIRRVLACAIALSLSLPSIALTQSEDDAASKARLLYEQGRAALYAGRPESARMVLQRAYELWPQPLIGFALGMAELDTGLFVEAATHMLLYMRQQPKPTREERKAFADAEKTVAHLMFDVNVDGARIYIDGEDLGNTPFVFQPVYVLAGRHTIRATCEGFDDVTQTYDVISGRRTDVRIVLQPKQRTASAAGASMPSSAPSASVVPSASAQPPRKPSGSSKAIDERTIVLATGGVLTVAAGVLAIIEATRAASAASDVDNLRQGQPYTCSTVQSSACSQLAEAESRRGTAMDIGRGALIGTAILGGATAAAWFFWPRSSVQITPQVHASAISIAVSGSL